MFSRLKLDIMYKVYLFAPRILNILTNSFRFVNKEIKWR